MGKSNGSPNSYHSTILNRDSRILESHDKAVESGRAEFFVSSWDPTVRNSLQAVILGNFFGLNAYSFCYGMISLGLFLGTYTHHLRHVSNHHNVSRLTQNNPHCQ